MAIELYSKVKSLSSNIEMISTDANSCYDVAFKRYNVTEMHVITKAETHLIESSNSSIRDMVTRLNRRTKRYSKSLQMIHYSVILWANKELTQSIFN